MKRRRFLAASALALAACRPHPDISGGFVGAALERGHLLRAPLLQRSPRTSHRTRVLVVGGGVAGLAACRALRLRGMHDFTLLELEDTAGGNSRGGEVNGISCPLGAHYLPVPLEVAAGLAGNPVQDLLEELGLYQRIAGRWVYDERHLCHSPQERLFINGQWQSGLLPLEGLQRLQAAALQDYQRFAQLVLQAAKTSKFSIPVQNKPVAGDLLALDAITFDVWLSQHQLTSAPLRWYLDYCCRDDYGAGLSAVSAWAGIHYFASRHGFAAPGEQAAERESGVLTWPEGNGWLTQQLAKPLGERLATGQVVLRVAAGKHGVEVDALNTASGQIERWQADHCIMALPLFVAAKVIENPPPALQAAARAAYAPWLVANVHLHSALHDRPGPAPSWDNVVYGGDGAAKPGQGHAEGLGYVDAMHQSLSQVRGATVLTHYRAFGIAPARRQHLYQQPWAYWRDVILAELAEPHPDLPGKVSRIDIMRYGHAMRVPVPGTRANPALRALQNPLPAPWQRLQFAHSDLSGYSVFEEAFTHGHMKGSFAGLSSD